MPTAFGRARVLPCVTLLAVRYPRLRFKVDLSDRYVDLLDGAYDLAVRGASTPQSGIGEQRIASFEMCLCASPAYVESGGVITAPPANLQSRLPFGLRHVALCEMAPDVRRFSGRMTQQRLSKGLNFNRHNRPRTQRPQETGWISSRRWKRSCGARKRKALPAQRASWASPNRW